MVEGTKITIGYIDQDGRPGCLPTKKDFYLTYNAQESKCFGSNRNISKKVQYSGSPS